MRALITGASGFLGRHVSSALRRMNAAMEIVGLHDRGDAVLPNLDEVIRVDLSDVAQLRSRLEGRTFDVCLHLAGALAGASRTALYRTNVAGTANLIDVVGCDGRLGQLVLVSSCAVYGAAGETGEADESTALDPRTAYAESCLAREMVARLLTADALEAVTLRLFNLVGPGQPDTMMIPTVARQLARMEKGLQPSRLLVGRLDTLRDYVDVRDAADAIAALGVGSGPFPPVLNLGSGVCWKGSEILEMLLSLSDVRPEITIAQNAVRLSDVQRIRNKSTLARTRIPWNPRFTLAESLRDTLEDWRTRPLQDIS